MKKRKRKKIKISIILLPIIIVLIIGGVIMIPKINHKPEKTNTKKEEMTKEITEKETSVTKEKAPKTHQEYLNLPDGEYETEKGYTLIKKGGFTYIEDLLIVNKTYSLPSGYIPENTDTPVTTERCNNCLAKEVMEAFKSMQSDAASIGLNIYISSGYRSYTYQDRIYNNYVSISGKENADTYSARPGHSEHQTGLCFDLNTIDDSFANTSEGKWVNENATNYGFIIRYPKGKETITGYQYESWHLRYVGKELAQKLYKDNNWITLEEYFGISSTYE